jgi:hypothetical protein
MLVQSGNSACIFLFLIGESKANFVIASGEDFVSICPAVQNLCKVRGPPNTAFTKFQFVQPSFQTYNF